jgi:Catalase
VLTVTLDRRHRREDRLSAVLKAALIVAMLLTFVACEKAPISVDPSERSDAHAQYAEIPYPSIDTFLGEKLHDNEEEVAQKITALMEQSIQDTSRTHGTAIRDAHPKAHGCVKAQFHVDDTLPASLTKGIFQPGHTYEAWIRLSNSSADPDQADITGDGRGMAVKLMGVPGKKLLETEREATTQDFIMISHPVFIIDDPSDYLAFQHETTSTHWLDKLFVPFTLGFKGFWNAHQITTKKIENPLQARYWSMVPYQLGTGAARQAIKFSAKPFSDPSQSCPDIRDNFPSDPSRNFLRQALRTTLAKGKVCMQFLLQLRTPCMSVEHSKDEWKESDAPFFQVATIQIPQQEFDTPEQNRFCENLWVANY